MSLLGKILIIVGIGGVLVGGLQVLGLMMYSTYPEFVEPGGSYWSLKFPTLIPGLLVIVGSGICILIGAVIFIKRR
jgi:hypothetical protein